jgi:hypothetical protein
MSDPKQEPMQQSDPGGGPLASIIIALGKAWAWLNGKPTGEKK